MRRFSFVTTATPTHIGEGVDFEDGRASYRLKENDGNWSMPYSGAIADITYQYGGLPGYVFTYEDL